MERLLVLALTPAVSSPACLRVAPAKPALEVVVLGSGVPRSRNSRFVSQLLVSRVSGYVLLAR